MKQLTQKLTKTLGLLLLLMAVVSSCKKSHNEDPTVPASTSNLSGKIDGKDIAISESALTTTYYASTGEPSSLLTSAALDNSGTKMDFFIPDLTAGTYNITPKLGTSSNPGNPGLKVQATTPTTTQTYISYTSTGNIYFAVSGTVIVTLDNDKVTVKWDISFKDATGRTFTSAGSFTIYFYKTVTKPKTEVKDPTPVTVKPTIDNISPTAGAAGDEVAIAGTNFSTSLTDDVVKFNGVAATVKTATATKLTVTVPQATTGVVTVKIANSETATGPTFTYVSAPTITGFTPSTGAAGDVVTITGTNFSTTAADNVVKFNGTAGTVTAATATSLTVTVPQGVTTGNITLSVKGGAAINGPLFTVKAPTTSLSWQEVYTPSPFMGPFVHSATVGNSLILSTIDYNWIGYSADGTTWTNLNTSFKALGETTVKQVVSDGKYYYFLTNKSLYKTVNGSEWIKINIPQGETTTLFFNGSDMYLILFSIIYKSTDGGANWSNYGTNSQFDLVSVVKTPDNSLFGFGKGASGNSYALYKSTDFAKSWTQVSAKSFYLYQGIVEQILTASGNNSIMISASDVTEYSIIRTRPQISLDGGKTFNQLSTDITCYAVYASGNLMIAGGGGKMSVSTDAGATFTQTDALPDAQAVCYVKTDSYLYCVGAKTTSSARVIYRTRIPQ